MAVNDVVKAFKIQKVEVQNGLIAPDIINKLLWS